MDYCNSLGGCLLYTSDNNGEYTGFDIEMAKEISNVMGKKIKFQPINWNMKESELNNRCV